jgi:hypothetical protein
MVNAPGFTGAVKSRVAGCPSICRSGQAAGVQTPLSDFVVLGVAGFRFYFALAAPGRITHAWQDLCAHAIRRHGLGVTKLVPLPVGAHVCGHHLRSRGSRQFLAVEDHSIIAKRER